MNEAVRKDPKRFIRQDIIEKVLVRDLPSLYGLTDIQELNCLFNYLVYQTGNEISFSGLSQSSGVAQNTLRKYLEYLEAAFLIKVIHRVNETGKSFKRASYFKVYLTNPSMYAAIYGLLPEDDSENIGGLVETALFSQWMHDGEWMSRLRYARMTQPQGEVDMVCLDNRFQVDWCLEAKWSDQYFSDPSQLKSFHRFCNKSGLAQAIVTTKTQSGTRSCGELVLQFQEVAPQETVTSISSFNLWPKDCF